MTPDEAKDIMIAWAVRELRRETVIHTRDGDAWPSRTLEYEAAARALVPDVDALAEFVADEPDLIIMDVLQKGTDT